MPELCFFFCDDGAGAEPQGFLVLCWFPATGLICLCCSFGLIHFYKPLLLWQDLRPSVFIYFFGGGGVVSVRTHNGSQPPTSRPLSFSLHLFTRLLGVCTKHHKCGGQRSVPWFPCVGWRDQWQVPLPSEPSQQFSLILNDTFTYYYLCFYYLILIFLFFIDF